MNRLTYSFANLVQRRLFDRSSRTYLFYILFLAFIIRVYGITRELPFITAPDVSSVYHGPKHMIFRVFSDQTPSIWNFIIPPLKYLPAFKYILFIGFSLATLLVGVYLQIVQGLSFSSAAGEAARWLIKSGGLIVTGRLVATIFSLLTIYLVYRLGKELFSREVGLTAALFLAVMPQHVSLSQYILVDSSLLFWTVLLAWFSYKIATLGDLKYYLAGGFVFGVLFSTKHSAPFFALFLLHAHFLRVRQEKIGWKRIVWDKRVLYSTGMILAGILLFFPSFFIEPEQYFSWVALIRNKSAHSLSSMTRSMNLREYFLYVPEMIRLWGLPFTVITFLGGALIMFRDNKAVQITVVTPFLFFLFMSSYIHKYYRWLGPAYPFFALWAAFLFCWAIEKLGPKLKDEKRRKTAVTVGLIMLVFIPFYSSVKSNYRINRPDTRITSFKWMRDNIPKGSVIASYLGHLYALPPLGSYKLVDIPFKKYNIENAVDKDRALALDAYREKGVQYFVLDSIHKSYHFKPNMMKRFPETARSFQDFYREMEASSELVFIQDRKTGDYKGPGIEIYRLRNNQGSGEDAEVGEISGL